ncbi:MAG: ribosome biogenesis GTP-binding protein YihA/YsxC [Syntrophaceae bacterium]
MLKVRDARYVGTIQSDVEALPEIAVAGRSNVGKSSLINALLNRKSLVQTSKQPGKTRNINYFRVDLVQAPSFYLVDMPGYGYAKVARSMQDEWRKLAQRYFADNRNLKMLLLLVDIRRDFRDEERMVLDLARANQARPFLVATKTDKLGLSERTRCLKALQAAGGLAPMASSAEKRWGLEEIWQVIQEALGI